MKSKFKISMEIILMMFIIIPGIAQEKRIDVSSFFGDIESSDLLILGTFHFSNPGLDSYKPKYDIDIFSSEKQKELKEVLDVIKRYQPTKIAIEVHKTKQGIIDSLYQAYLKGEFELKSNEIYQIGFRLAKMLGHTHVYAVDAKARSFEDGLTDQAYEAKSNYFTGKASQSSLQREYLIEQNFNELYTKEDLLKTKMSLLDYFLLLNDSELVRIGHGHYLVGQFKMGEKDDYFGPDNTIFWYSRNLRIFHNLLQINEPGKDKIFFLVGAGHLPILNFLSDASVDFDKKDFKDFVKK